MSGRILILKIVGTIATLIAGGCELQPSKPVEHTLTIEVKGEGKVNVGGDAQIDVKSTSAATPSAAVCSCGCGKIACTCSKGNASAAPAMSKSEQGRSPQELPEIRFYVAPWCVLCKPAEKALEDAKDRLPFRVRKMLVPNGINPPAFYWQRRDGSWMAIQGWHGVEPTIEAWRANQ